MVANKPNMDQAPRQLLRELRDGDLDQAALFLSRMIDTHLKRHPDSEDMLTIFIEVHVVQALDFIGYLERMHGTPFEAMISIEVHRFMTEYRNEPGATRELAQQVLERIDAFAHADSAEKKRKDPSVRRSHIELVRAISGYLDSHYRDPRVTVTRTAEYFDMSVSYLSRIFHQATGIKLGDYILMLRFEEAKRLLRTTDTPISEIGAKCGFASCSAFIRSFRTKEGITPGAYRRGA